jgi:molybdopterin molybdotransferase
VRLHPTSGGVGGDFDFVKPVLEEIGEMLFCKVKMRPGNPQTLGTIGGVPFFGLPGNPTSTYVGFEVFVRPALRRMQGLSAIARPVTVARLSHDVKKGTALLPAWACEKAERRLCRASGSQSSAF